MSSTFQKIILDLEFLNIEIWKKCISGIITQSISLYVFVIHEYSPYQITE